MKKRVLALLLAATMVFGLTACGGSDTPATDNTQAQDNTDAAGDEATDAADDQAPAGDAQQASTGEKILSVQVGPDPETIDPALNSAVDGGNMLLHSFECLLSVDQEGKLVPGQAESW